MGFIELIIISIALAMDAFAVSITCGISNKQPKASQIIKVSLFFGFFQFLMPVIGYFAGCFIPFDITLFDHWIAFGLLSFIGIHMIKESKEECEEPKDLFRTRTLLIAAIATSIDALAAGFSVSLLDAKISLLAISAGIITFIFSFTGVKLGSKIGHHIEKKAELFSGIVLIIIGIKIVIEHLIK